MESTALTPRALAYVEVILAGKLHKTLYYAVPQHWPETLHIGSAVFVPLLKQAVLAYVLKIYPQCPISDPSYSIRSLSHQATQQPALPEDLLQMISFASQHYHSPIGQLLTYCLPKKIHKAKQSYTLTELGENYLQQLQQNYLLKNLAIAKLSDSILDKLAQHKKPVRLERLQSLAPSKKILSSTLKLLQQKLLIAPYKDYQQRSKLPATNNTLEESQPEKQDLSKTQSRSLTPEQAEAVKHLSSKLFQGFHVELLWGVTGSGKTEIYMQLIQQVLDRGQTALMLLPEIALTPQLSRLFQERFAGSVAVIHSGLKDSVKDEQWQRVLEGEARIALGVRSALFLPLKNIGILIVDEEHESSFKQEEGCRYHARDLAIVRAQNNRCLVVLGSATPSLESFRHSELGRYGRTTLKHRVQMRPLPTIQTIDLKEHRADPVTGLSEPLLEALRQTIAQDEQAILFLNRRGFAPYVFCQDCGYSYRCTACDVALTYYQKKQRLLCHYCGDAQIAPKKCQSCQSDQITTSGRGTEKIEQALSLYFPEEIITRLDRDLIRNQASLETILKNFREGHKKILIGTQMVTKGHDFPNVTLVGVLQADAALNQPDFRAAEKTFQILTQVAGRAGRGSKAGRVFLQTYHPEHNAIAMVCQHNFADFAEQELQIRQELSYPPFAKLALVRWSGNDEAKTLAQAKKESLFLEQFKSSCSPSEQISCRILGPAPSPVSRIRQRFRFQTIIKAQKHTTLHTLLRQLEKTPEISCVQRSIDMDAILMS